MIDPVGWPIARILVLVAAVGGCAAGVIFGWQVGGPRLAMAHGAIGLTGGLFGSFLILATCAIARKWLTDPSGTTTDYDDPPPAG
jgi:hypothetical protein